MTAHRFILHLLLALQAVGQAFPAGLVLCREADGTVRVEPTGGGFSGSAPCGPASCAGWCGDPRANPSDRGTTTHPVISPALAGPGDGDDCSDLSLRPFPGLHRAGPAPAAGPVTPGAPVCAAVPGGAPPDTALPRPSPPGGPPLSHAPGNRIPPLRI
ncbi:MAG: hypothetical protein KA419_14840 [Acidobacteria bacterium]|nr:hypothetical protein [Acidobacteriota bacterium]